MDLGTGIFLSTLVFSVVVLYGITKDRWNWRRLVKRTAAFCLGLILLGAATGGGIYLYDHIPPTITRQTQYAGLRLGMIQDEVLYTKGYPPTVHAEDASDSKVKDMLVLDTNKLEKGKSARDYRHWSYNGHKHSINVVFDDGGAVVAIQCFSEDKLGRCPPIAEIEDGNHETKVLRILGENPQAKLSGVTKSLTYPALGLRLNLEKQQVYMLEVGSPGYRR